VGKLIRGAQVSTKGENTTKHQTLNFKQIDIEPTNEPIYQEPIYQEPINQKSDHRRRSASTRRIAQIISSSNSRDPAKSAAAAPLRDHLAAARAAEATRASIRSMANWPSARRTRRAAPGLPSGINIATNIDCTDFDPCSVS
jgi:hypothetical protein